VYYLSLFFYFYKVFISTNIYTYPILFCLSLSLHHSITIGPLTPEHIDLFMQNPRFAGLKFPDMSNPETLQNKYMGELSKSALQFMNGCLAMDPSHRMNSARALEHTYFDEIRNSEVQRLQVHMNDLAQIQLMSNPTQKNRKDKNSTGGGNHALHGGGSKVDSLDSGSRSQTVTPGGSQTLPLPIEQSPVVAGSQIQSVVTAQTLSWGQGTTSKINPVRGNDTQSILAAGRQALLDAGEDLVHGQGKKGGGVTPRLNGASVEGMP